MAKIIVLMGAPGAGKGTQARLLQERLHLPQISTGDMFRALAETDSPLALEVKELQDAGKLIPDELVIRVVRERTSQPDCKNGYVLDGFPRTPAQAATLEGLAAEQGKKIIAIVVDELCDRHLGVKLDQRTDDTPEKISVRLKTYEEQTRPLVGYYEQSHRLNRIDGTQEPEAIYRQIEGFIKSDED